MSQVMLIGGRWSMTMAATSAPMATSQATAAMTRFLVAFAFDSAVA
jgi:hypothetical protein